MLSKFSPCTLLEVLYPILQNIWKTNLLKDANAMPSEKLYPTDLWPKKHHIEVLNSHFQNRIMILQIRFTLILIRIDHAIKAARDCSALFATIFAIYNLHFCSHRLNCHQILILYRLAENFRSHTPQENLCQLHFLILINRKLSE